MGKDNVPFHTLSFPATLLGSGEPWKLVDYIKSFNYLNYEGGKFSTSQNRGVFMDAALGILPADYWRWWLLANIPEGSDSNFTWESFQAGANKDLADVLGNFVSRVTKFAAARFGAAVPTGGGYGPAEAGVIAEIERRLRAYEDQMQAIELRKAAHELRAIWVVGNEYLQAAAPWAAIRSDPERAAAITRFAFNLIRLYAILSRPFLPDTSDAMLRALGLADARWPDDAASALAALPAGHPFEVPGLLFAKLDDARRDALEARFAGGG
jgi:methionyl-tRNA synthetase